MLSQNRRQILIQKQLTNVIYLVPSNSFFSEPRLGEPIRSLSIRKYFHVSENFIVSMHIMFEICLRRHSEYWGKVGLSAYFHEDLRLGFYHWRRDFYTNIVINLRLKMLRYVHKDWKFLPKCVDWISMLALKIKTIVEEMDVGWQHHVQGAPKVWHFILYSIVQ